MAKDISNLKLNKEQIEAIKYKKGPLLIIAGAGTGKTTVITERIKYLILGKYAKPNEILALTFTEKAAKEMEERVDVSMPYGYTQMWIMTFHSFCDRILRQEALHIGLDPKFKLMTQSETVQFIRNNVFKFDLDYFRPLGNPTRFVAGMLQHFSRLQDEDVAPAEYLSWVKKQILKLKLQKNPEEEKLEIKKWNELASAFKVYEELKIKEGVMDFGDLIVKTLELFRKRLNILKSYRDQFKYVLVDEFQDTNYGQNEIVKLLVGKNGNITVVADDDQCLPPNSVIDTQEGGVPIKKIKVGDGVVTAVGKGYLSTAKVLHINKAKKKARFLIFTTESGKRLEATDNHKMFCMIPGKKIVSGNFYVYLMFRQDLGWRIGITDDLSQRLKLERSADKIVAIKSCGSLEEVRFFETVYSMRYQIPTYPFKPRKRMILTEDWLRRLFSEFDTWKGVEKLSRDLGVDLSSHHYALASVVRGNKERVKIILKMCSRRNRTKWAKGRFMLSPKVLHEVGLETSSKLTKGILDKANVEVAKARKGWKVRKMFASLEDAGKFAKKLTDLTGGFFEARFDVGKRNLYSRSALMMPAGNIFPGMCIPVRKDYAIIYERVVDRDERIKTETVYDLEVERSHNFIADGVVVHNSIYRFRGAAVSNVIQFRKSFPKTKIVVLTRNYRSTQEILDRSYNLIQFNNPDRLEVVEKINKRLVSQVSPASREASRGDPITFVHSDRVENEAEEVAKEIEKLTANPPYEFRDIAILIRANNHAEPFMRALSRHGIPYQFLGPGRLFKQPEIIDLISYLKVLYNYEDSVSLYRLLSLDFFDIPSFHLASICNYARKYNLSLFEAAEKIGDMKVKNILDIIKKHLGMVKKETAGQILFYFLSDTGLLPKMLTPEGPEAERRAMNISKFFDKLKTYEVDHENATVPAVVDWLELSSELGESPVAADIDWNDVNAVNILTAHSAKGLEFSVVFLVNLVAQRFPTTERREQIPIPDKLIKEVLPVGDYHLEEERRLFYVGMTRAKELLYLTAADYYGEGKREKRLSPFIFESLGDKAISDEQPKNNVDQLSFLDYKSKTKPSEALAKLGEAFHIDYLSYSQIETFKVCPLHYKLKYIYKVPTPLSASASFGTSIHTVLKDFYEQVKSGVKPTENFLFRLLEDNWIKEGYKDKKHEKEFFEKGKLYLSGFLKDEFNPKNLPVALEQLFTVPLIDPTSRKASRGFASLKIGGKIDRVDQLADGLIEIVDYKTGATIPSQKEVDKNLQLSFYALAASSIPQPPFGIKPEKIKLSLYFLDNQEKISTTRTKKRLEEAVAEIFKVRDEIQKSDFKCSGHMFCQTNCEYSLFCKSD